MSLSQCASKRHLAREQLRPVMTYIHAAIITWSFTNLVLNEKWEVNRLSTDLEIGS
jgi:hypothetical protein